MAMNVRHSVRFMLQVEGAVIAAAALWLALEMQPPLWMWIVVLIAPDLSFAGYLFGPRVGAVAYNLSHTLIWPILLGLQGFVQLADASEFTSVILITISALWALHIGVDRMLGYGLKYPSAFKHTHLMWKN
ncbi:MAG: DUF4260 domain-containing protein [Paracoccaceae bacterium]|nr:DUF4260 domain-containing protein [Paracoccaceae bacterium]